MDKELLHSVLPEGQTPETGYAVLESDRIEINLADAIIQVDSGVDLSVKMDSVEIQESASIGLEIPDGMGFDQVDKRYIRPIMYYFSLAFNSPVHPSLFKARVQQESSQRVDIYHPYHSYSENESISRSMIFTDLHVSLEDSLSKWIRDYHDKKVLYELYFGNMYDESMYVEFQFFALSVALETQFNHLIQDVQVVDDDEFNNILKDINEVLPNDEEISERIMNLLKPIGNQPSFKEKITAVFDQYEQVLSPIIDLDKTASEATRERHKIAHGLGTVELVNILPLLQRIDAITSTIFYDKIGLSDSQIQYCVRQRLRDRPVGGSLYEATL
jgi:hypothetical protein